MLIPHNIFIMAINKLTKSLKVIQLTKNLIHWSQSVTSSTKKLFQREIGNLISFWEFYHFDNILFKRRTSFELCDILFSDFGWIPNNSCNQKKSWPSKIIVRNQEYNTKKQSISFGGSIPPIPTCSQSAKNIFSTIFYSHLNMRSVHTFPMELEYTMHYLSSRPFC